MAEKKKTGQLTTKGKKQSAAKIAKSSNSKAVSRATRRVSAAAVTSDSLATDLSAIRRRRFNA